MSTDKRLNYVLDNEASSSEEESYDDSDNISNNKNELNNLAKNSKRKPKCFSKNALMARENRLKKKLYISKLESDVTSLKRQNKKLSKVVDNQSCLITELKNEVKYLKSVVANSSDISKLIRNIHQTTGMSVTSSLDKNLSLNNVCVPKPKLPVARKTAHPWEEVITNPNLTPDSNYFSSPDHGLSDDVTADFFSDIPLELPIDIDDNFINNLNFDDKLDNKMASLEDHNYILSVHSNKDLEDVGVCLHVSRNRVSLEFCPSCSDKASQAWLS